MRRIDIGLVAVTLCLRVIPAAAQGPTALMQAKGCMACHDVSQAKMAPSFQTIAAEYRGQPDAEQKLITELKTGAGHMKIDATDAELQQLVSAVLATH